MTLSTLMSHPLTYKITQAIIISLVILVLAHFLKNAIAHKAMDKDTRYKARKVTDLVVYVAILVAVLLVFSSELHNLTVIVGAFSLGIGFAMREVIQSLIAWLTITFSGVYKVGQRIQMGGLVGDVIDISPLTTTLMECGGWVKGDLYNGRLVKLSNGLIFKDPVINYTADFPFLWDEIVIPVRTDSNYTLARSLIEEVAKTVLAEVSDESKKAWQAFGLHYRVEAVKLEPMITMSFDANWIEFTLRYAVDYKARRGTKDKLFSAILEQFTKTAGEVQIGSASFQITELPTLQLKRSKT
ncbi:MAG: mechanosensitive ion channel domain-containing protein [Methylophilaceae bacterium]